MIALKETPFNLFAAVAEASRAEGFEVLVIGGHAVNAYGYVRTTLDADFLVCEDDFALIRHVFESLGYGLSARGETFARMDPRKSDAFALPVDLMLVSRETFCKLQEGQRELPFGATKLKVPPPLHLIALKLHAMRNNDRRRAGKDLTDILQIIRVCEIDVGSAEFAAILERYANPQSRLLLTAALA